MVSKLLLACFPAFVPACEANLPARNNCILMIPELYYALTQIN